MDPVIQFQTAIRWQDLVDILITSYVLFRFYVLFRGTNVLRVLFALACIWFAQRIATSAGFIVSGWISQGIVAAAALIIIVVFRNEIRAVLQTQNIKAILWQLPRRQTTTPLEVIAESAFEMSRRRIGALIVVPGKEDLEELVQHGISWQGTVSKEMIISIFWPDNPVHDGAAVIRGSRVQEVGCILPLSKRDDLPSSYGTRHRAALGLVESSDAMVVIVSEESRAVSIARKGRISQVANKDRLEQLLRTHTGIRLKAKPGFMNEGLEFALAGILSVLIVTGIWFSITRGQDILETFDVPVEYVNRASQLEIMDTSTTSVQLRLSGSRSIIGAIRPDQLRVVIDLSQAVDGKNNIPINNDNLTLPPGVILNDVNPHIIEVAMDVLIEKEIPVQADWIGLLNPALILTEAVITPEKINFIGGRNLLDSIRTIYTEKIPVDRITRSEEITVSLDFNPAKLKISSGDKSKVAVRFTVTSRLPP
ncbi:MAG: hypothetical protein AMJ54_01445 [Deltaproteobacteria bacterium SG8_13]|nr:MAG: hypothetical protein AMJ54_01445 [Deltaproteobacteria bacterium SG8_13]